MNEVLPVFMLCAMLVGIVAMVYFAFAGPSMTKAQARRVEQLKVRHDGSGTTTLESQMRRVLAARETRLDTYFTQFVPKPDLLRKRISMTGKSWTLGHFVLAICVLTVVISAALLVRGLPPIFAIMIGVVVGFGAPHIFLGMLIKKRLKAFNARFPDAIELLVRGLRSGLPISETLTVVASEVKGPVGVEFRSVTDKIKIGKTMDQALQETAERLGTAEFQFFVITLSIQRETGGNLAETLSNLAEVLRKRMQMKLKIAAMSSESKASAYIIGALPFVVFGLVYMINQEYMMKFFTDERLMVIGGGGLVWMGVGAFIMRQMINFEI